MKKEAFTGVLTLLLTAMMLSGCVRMPYDGGNYINMPEEFKENIEEVQYEEPELEAIIQIEGNITQLENETNNLGENEEGLTQFDLDELEEELPEGVFKRIIVNEGDSIDLSVNAMDPDGNVLMYTFSAPLNQEGKWNTKRGDAGEYISDIVVSDGDLETSARLLLVVNSINKIPVMEEIDNIVVKEGESVSLSPAANDGNNDIVVFSYSGFMEIPKKEITYDMVSCQEGIYDCMQTFVVRVTASDGFSEVSQDVGVTVINNNRAPVIEPISDIVVDELESIEIVPQAVDPDGNEVQVSFTSPLGEDGNLQTKRGDAGEYVVYATASDGELSTSEKFKVTINSINENPILAPISDMTVRETETVILRPGAIDANNDTITFEFTGWMTSYKYETTYEDAGEHIVKITAKDPYGGYDSKEITVTVLDVNRAPVILGVY